MATNATSLDHMVSDPVSGAKDGVWEGAHETLTLAAKVVGAGVAGYVIGDWVPQLINQYALGALQFKIPAAWGVPYAMSIVEQAVTGHANLKDTPFWALASAPFATEYLAKNIVAPVGKAFFGAYKG